MDSERWRLVRDVFEAVLASPAGQREGVLEARCAGDAALLGEVRSLLVAAAATEPGALDRLGARLTGLGELFSDDSPPDRAGPYVVIEEAGRGGMGVVYRAHDPRLRRTVALKFLSRHLGGHAAARARFIEEARAASALDHPHICTIHDIGSAEDGRLYIAMAWYGGGTLAHRLRAGPLAVAEVVRITIAVAEALDRAHRAGIVHRDIKPANIAFADDGQAKVLDFGVASLEEHARQTAGGTPAYMAPEQLTGGEVDRRADVWALGALLHEMLAGAPPFEGADRNALRHAITHEPVRALDRVRFDVPAALGAVVARAMAKDPAVRFATAAELAAALRAALAPPRRRPVRGLVAAAACALLIGVVGARAWRSPDAPRPDARVVAVLPFRVSGDAATSYLREGMADLLSAGLTGEGGLRAADPRAVYSAWRRRGGADTMDLPVDEALDVAHATGAASALLGEVVGTAERLIVNTTLVDARGRVRGRARAQGSHVELPALVDALVAQVLSLSAGEEPQRVATLTSTSLPALRAFLEGQSAYRRGRYEEALGGYGRALELDSTFALAGLGIELAGGWVGGVEPLRERGRGIAWRHRDRLSAADRALLLAILGPAYPRRPSSRAQMDAIEEALRMTPERVELWYHLADLYTHEGRVMDVPDWEARAETALRRAIELDSTFSAPLHHLVLLYGRQGNVARLQEASALQLEREPAGATADYIRWRRAAVMGVGASEVPPFEALSVETLGWIALNVQDDGIDTGDGVRAMRERLARPGTRADRFERTLGLYAFALNGGRPSEALALTEDLSALQPDPGFVARLRILDALWADGDTTAATAALHSLDGMRVTDPVVARLNGCVAEQWRLVRGGPGRGSDRRSPVLEPPSALVVCEAVVDALGEVVGGGRAGERTARLDSLVSAGPFDLPVGDGHIEYVNSALAAIFERAGEPALALRAIGRRLYFLGWQGSMAASLRAEARLAESLGDTARAARAAEHHLVLRRDAEPARRAQADSMRALLRRVSRG